MKSYIYHWNLGGMISRKHKCVSIGFCLKPCLHWIFIDTYIIGHQSIITFGHSYPRQVVMEDVGLGYIILSFIESNIDPWDLSTKVFLMCFLPNYGVCVCVCVCVWLGKPSYKWCLCGLNEHSVSSWWMNTMLCVIDLCRIGSWFLMTPLSFSFVWVGLAMP